MQGHRARRTGTCARSVELAKSAGGVEPQLGVLFWNWDISGGTSTSDDPYLVSSQVCLRRLLRDRERERVLHFEVQVAVCWSNYSCSKSNV
jgi:hypothetical protein